MKKYIIGLFGLSLMAIGCKKQTFVDANIDPTIVYSVKPENQFFNGSQNLVSDFESYYEIYRNIMPWLQLNTLATGNQRNFTGNANPFYRYDDLYSRGGGRNLYDVNVLISEMPSPQKETYTQVGAISRILLDYMFFYVSDIYGSIAYTDAFKGRYTLEFPVKFDKQQEIFNGIDADLKAAIAQIKGAGAGQVSLGAYDQFYFGDASKWIKAANALRLRIAFRMLKADATKATATIKEVAALAATDLMSTDADSWIFYATSSYASGGNFLPDALRAPKALTNFMLSHNDPRLRIFFTKNSYSQENFDLAKTQGKLPAGAVFQNQRYVGSFASPDSAANPVNVARYYTTRTITKGGNTLTLDTLSNINPRLFQTAYNSGTGTQLFPLVTYADFAFMMAEAVAKGIVTTGTAADWYNKGVTSSMNMYGKMATLGNVLDYYAEAGGTAVAAPTPAEISAYLALPDVAYNAAKGLDQIASQSFINFYREPNEAWALVKRTGMPNTTTTLMLEKLTYNGTELSIPRRAPRALPTNSDLNYENIMAAYAQMATDADYGQGPGDITGRVWWDKK